MLGRTAKTRFPPLQKKRIEGGGKSPLFSLFPRRPKRRDVRVPERARARECKPPNGDQFTFPSSSSPLPPSSRVESVRSETPGAKEEKRKETFVLYILACVRFRATFGSSPYSLAPTLVRQAKQAARQAPAARRHLGGVYMSR